jgi:small subunit ribosomal protein S1
MRNCCSATLRISGLIKMNHEEKKVGLSIKAVGEEASRQEVEHSMHPASSSSTSTTIDDLISWKRAGGDSN